MNDKQESVAATKKSTTSKKESTIATKLVTAIEAALGPKSAKSLRTQQTSSSFSGPVSTQACGYGGYEVLESFLLSDKNVLVTTSFMSYVQLSSRMVASIAQQQMFSRMFMLMLNNARSRNEWFDSR